MGFGEIYNFTDVNDFIDDPTFLEALYEYIEADEDIIDKSLNEKKKRTGSDKIDYWETKWGEIRNPNSCIEHTRAGKLWQRRFRSPRVIFDMIVEKCNEGNIFCVKDQARVRLPTGSKVMMASRILAREICTDDIAEMSCGYVYKFLRLNSFVAGRLIYIES